MVKRIMLGLWKLAVDETCDVALNRNPLKGSESGGCPSAVPHCQAFVDLG